MTFDTEVEKVLAIEGGYSNNPNDSGGETIWGITKAVARAFGYTSPMKDMTRTDAKTIYKKRYWDAMRLDEIDVLASEISSELFDTGINCGVQRAGEFFQRSLNVLNQRGDLFADMNVDGRIGPMTLAAFHDYLRHRGHFGRVVLLRALNALQGAFYIELAEQREKDEGFLYGWLSHRVM